MYFLRRILFAASMIFLTAAGALFGATALPLIRRAFLNGLQAVEVRLRPPAEASLQLAARAGEAKEERRMRVRTARPAANTIVRRA